MSSHGSITSPLSGAPPVAVKRACRSCVSLPGNDGDGRASSASAGSVRIPASVVFDTTKRRSGFAAQAMNASKSWYGSTQRLTADTISRDSTMRPSARPRRMTVYRPSCSFTWRAMPAAIGCTSTTRPPNRPRAFSRPIIQSTNARRKFPSPNCSTFSGSAFACGTASCGGNTCPDASSFASSRGLGGSRGGRRALLGVLRRGRVREPSRVPDFTA